MKILALTPRLPYPPNRGDVLRAWGQIRYLAQRHDVYLACIDHGHPSADDIAHVRRVCREVCVFPVSRLAALARGVALWTRGASITQLCFHHSGLARLVRAWSQSIRFDAVFSFSTAMAPYSEMVNAGRRVLDFSDVDSAKWQTYADRAVWPLNCIYRSEARRVRQLEQRCAEQQDICIVVNDREQRKLLTHCDSACVEVLPVALAADEYPSDGPRPSAPRNPVVGFTGSMFYPPNIRAALWFGRHVWPIIRAKRPDAQWLVVGSRPASAVRRLAKLPGVSVTGSVADMRPLLARMRVFVNPVDGDIGVQTKLLVAMAAGVPAVVTPDAAAGIDYDGPPPFEIAASPTQFANAVLRLLDDDARAMELARRGREVIETRYDEATHYRRLETWLAGATDERASAESPARAARDLAGAAR